MESNSYIFTNSIVGTTGANTAPEINATNAQIQSWWAQNQEFVNINNTLPRVPSNQRTVKGE